MNDGDNFDDRKDIGGADQSHDQDSANKAKNCDKPDYQRDKNTNLLFKK